MKVKKSFIFLFIIQFLTTALLLLVVSTYSANNMHHDPVYPTTLHKVIYVDPKFDEKEYVFITWAASEWTERTNHIITFEVVKLPQKILDFNKGIIIIKVDEYDPDILELDSFNHNATLGLCSTEGSIPNIKLVGSRIKDKYYKAVVAHELGHSLGLEHNKGLEGVDTLMYPAVDFGADHITKTDLENLCKLYHCDAKKLADE